MATLHIEHKITDLPTWQKAFERFAQIRENAGVLRTRVHQPLDDDKYIYVQLDFERPEEADAFKTFLEMNVWAASEASPGLDGTPTARVLNDVKV